MSRSRRTRLLMATLIAAAVSSGCAERPRAAETWHGTIDTLPSGVIHVQNPEEGIWAVDRGWRAIEELRIGAQAGDGPETFSEIAAFGVSPNGLIHVIDGHAQEVRVFTPTGAHVRSFGGRGAGPAEFSRALGLDWDSAGRLWITDPGNGRYAVYDSAGSLLFHAPRTVPGVVFPWLGGFARSGAFYDLAVGSGTSGITNFTYYRIGDTGAIVAVEPPIEHRITGPPAFSMTLFWLTPRTTFVFDPKGYLWIANTGDYRVIQRTLTGDTVRIVTRSHSRAPVSQAERDSIAKELRAAPPGYQDASIPNTRPVIERMFIDPDSYLYVKRLGDDLDTGMLFDVFDSDGRFLGALRSGVRFVMMPAPPRFHSGAIYGVAADSLGVQYLVKARVQRDD